MDKKDMSGEVDNRIHQICRDVRQTLGLSIEFGAIDDDMELIKNKKPLEDIWLKLGKDNVQVFLVFKELYQIRDEDIKEAIKVLSSNQFLEGKYFEKAMEVLGTIHPNKLSDIIDMCQDESKLTESLGNALLGILPEDAGINLVHLDWADAYMIY